MPAVASAATAVVIAHVAGGTSTIRVGAGGIMLPNHAPLVIAEQFGTLDGALPWADRSRAWARAWQRPADGLALRRGPNVDFLPAGCAGVDCVPARARTRDRRVKACRAPGSQVPIWILGSSLYGASSPPNWACRSRSPPISRPTAVAALGSTVANFKTLGAARTAYVMAGINTFAADTDEEAARLFTSLQQAFLGMVGGGAACSSRRSRHGRPLDTRRASAASNG